MRCRRCIYYASSVVNIALKTLGFRIGSDSLLVCKSAKFFSKGNIISNIDDIGEKTLSLKRFSLNCVSSMHMPARIVKKIDDQTDKEVTSGNNTLFDKTLFSSAIDVVAVKIPLQEISSTLKELRGDLLNMPRKRNVVAPEDLESVSTRLVLLNRNCVLNDDGIVTGLSEASSSFLKERGLGFTTYSVCMEYEDYSVDQVLCKLLGDKIEEGKERVHAFESVGHIAHLNLRNHLLPFKHIIAQVILDKNPRFKTVVNKTGEICCTFRTFPMEILAGKDDTNVELSESGCTFEFDFRNVYWNSRLQAEHARLISFIEQEKLKGLAINELELHGVFDMMAGVGPFAIPLAKLGFTVYANDLNPHSFEALLQNARLNKITLGERFQASCECGRNQFKKLLEQKKKFGHIIMNLPASAIDFLDTFKTTDWTKEGFSTPPLVHCYCFSSGEDPSCEAIQRVEASLGTRLDRRSIKVHFVRDVAPKKPMLCLTFRLPNFEENLDETKHLDKRLKK